MAVTPQDVVAGLERRGIPRTAAIGLAGNFAVESGFNPGINEISPVVPGSRGGYGLAQWTGPRRKQFEAFARSQGRALDDLDTQLDFTVWELQNTEKAAARDILSAATPEEAARAVSERFLRPGIPHLERRIAQAQQIAGAPPTATDAQPAAAGLDLGAMLDDLLGADQSGQQAQPSPAEVYQQAAGLDLGAAMDSLLGAPEENIAQPPSIDVNTMEIPEPQGRFSLDITRQTAAPMAEVAGAAMRGVTGAGPSLVGQMLPEGTPGFVGRVGDVGVAALSGMGALTTGAAGLVGDVAEAAGMSPGSSQRLARDLAAMPDALAGSPGQFVGQSTNLAARARQAVSEGVDTVQRALPSRPAPLPAPLATQAPEMTAEAFGQLARQAANGGMGSRAAAQRLAAEARVNPEAAAAAERLGVNLPADVLSDHTQLRAAVGLTRSQAGSLAEADWRDTVIRSIDRADEAIAEIGGSPDLSDISDRVFRSLDQTKRNLEEQSDFIYKMVNGKVPPNTIFEPNNVVSVLNTEISNLRGVGGLTKDEMKLYNMVTNPDQPVTYAAIMREKSRIGERLKGGGKAYGDADPALLKRLYGALSEDQMSNVQRILGDDYRLDLEVANGLYAKMKALDGTIADAFGGDGRGSVASALRIAINQGAKGDIKNLNKVLSVVPKELRGEAILSSISNLARTNTGGLGPGQNLPFGFAEYSKLYRGLRQNSQVYGAIAKELEPEQLRLMNDLFQISSRMTDARGAILSTGKANQVLQQNLFAEGIVAKVLNTAPGRTTRAAIGGAGGAIFGGNLGAAIGAGLASGNVGKNRMEAASRLFRSPQFQQMMEEAATTGQVSQQAQRRLSRSGAMKQFARAAGITDPQAWLAATVATGQAAQSQEGQ